MFTLITYYLRLIKIFLHLDTASFPKKLYTPLMLKGQNPKMPTNVDTSPVNYIYTKLPALMSRILCPLFRL